MSSFSPDITIEVLLSVVCAVLCNNNKNKALLSFYLKEKKSLRAQINWFAIWMYTKVCTVSIVPAYSIGHLLSHPSNREARLPFSLLVPGNSVPQRRSSMATHFHFKMCTSFAKFLSIRFLLLIFYLCFAPGTSNLLSQYNT